MVASAQAAKISVLVVIDAVLIVLLGLTAAGVIGGRDPDPVVTFSPSA